MIDFRNSSLVWQHLKELLPPPKAAELPKDEMPPEVPGVIMAPCSGFSL